jgi:dTDP-4-amino-4,6-dideoxygalactose transaminase
MKQAFARPLLGEEEKEAVNRVLSGPILVHGPKAHEFEEAFAAFTRAPFAVSVSSCTAALHLAYFYLGIGPGDEVIVPAQTHVATAHAVELCGAKPVFVDAEIRTGNIDLDRIEKAIGPRTKAISIVHFLGMPVAMDRVNAIAQKRGLFVVEDCALAVGTRYRGVHAGLHGDVGCFSFYPVKHFTTAEGGMLVTRHEKVAAKIARQKAFGVDRTVGERKVPGVYDVTMLGFNYRMNEIQAAIGIEQLKRVPGFLEKRRRNHERLSRLLAAIPEVSLFESSGGDFQSSHYCLSALLKNPAQRFEIIRALKERGIGTSVYYPEPVPFFTYYREKYGAPKTAFPVARRISESSISLPVGPHLEAEDMDVIAEALKQAIAEVKA